MLLVLMSRMVSVDVSNIEACLRIGHSLFLICQPNIRGHQDLHHHHLSFSQRTELQTKHDVHTYYIYNTQTVQSTVKCDHTTVTLTRL